MLTALRANPAGRALRPALLAVWLAAATAAAAGNAPPAPGRYAVDSEASWLYILVYRAGLLRRLGHNHVIAHRRITGCLSIAGELADSKIALRLPLQELEVDDRELRQAAGEDFSVPVPQDDIDATRRNMLGKDLLDAAGHPLAVVESTAVDGSYPAPEVRVIVGLRGAQHALTLPVSLTHANRTITATGSLGVSHSDLGLQPFTAALGALRVAEDLQFSYRLVADRIANDAPASACQDATAVVDDDNVPGANRAPE